MNIAEIQGYRLCNACRGVDLAKLLAGPGQGEAQTLDLSGDGLCADRCQLCRLLGYAIAFESLPPAEDGGRLIFTLFPAGRGRMRISLGNERVGMLRLERRDASFPCRPTERIPAWLKLVRRFGNGDGSSPAQLRGRTTEDRDADSSRKSAPAGTVDFSVFTEAIANCERNHSQFCRSSRPEYGSHETMELFVVDVRKWCLVKAWANQKYAALSYVWGNVEMLQTKRSNVSELRKTGGLIRHRSDLPRVVRDAIQVVRELGMRYLWVDTLCIVQDDERAKHSQIAKMNVIFSHAMVTLVAVDGKDATAALRGASSPPTVVEEQIDDLRITAVPPDISAILKSSHYNTRVGGLRRCLKWSSLNGD